MAKSANIESEWSVRKTLEMILSASKKGPKEIEITLDPRANPRSILDSICFEVVGTDDQFSMRSTCYTKTSPEKNCLGCHIPQDIVGDESVLRFFAITNGRTVSIELPVL